MELRHLRAFVVLSEERHFGRAAARLHVAQPALSQTVKQLERQLGSTLFDRSTRRVELTEAGRLLRSRAVAVLEDVARAEAELADLAEGRLGRVAVGFVGTATYDLLPRVARQVRTELPSLDLQLRGETLAPQLLDGVRGRTLDLAVLRPVAADMAGLVVEHLRREPLVAVLPSGHPFAEAGAVALSDLAGEPFVTHPSGRQSFMHQRVLAACRSAGFQPSEVVEVGETATLVVFVAAGLGVALVPASVQSLRLDGVAYVPLAGRPETVELLLVRRPDASAAALRVASAVKAEVG